jgi:GH25 family lysozyme M1 (1,4-beta-N-acetylmuramidase)
VNEQGVDVSAYQSLATIGAQLPTWRFGFVKATEGIGYVNPIHERQLALFAEAGRPTGLYHFLRHDEPALAQWRHFAQYLAPHRGRVVLAVDHETDESGVRPSLRLVRAFVGYAHKSGYRIGRYASLSTFYDGQVGADWRWIADWRPEPPPLQCAFWQRRVAHGFDLDTFLGRDLHAFWKANVYHVPRRRPRVLGGGGLIRPA